MKLALKGENGRKHKGVCKDTQRRGRTRCTNTRDEKGKARGKRKRRWSTYKSLACGQPFVTSAARIEGGSEDTRRGRGGREGGGQTSSNQSRNLLVMVLLVRLRGRNDCLLVLLAFGHPSFTDRRKLAIFPLLFLVLSDPLEKARLRASLFLFPFSVFSRSRVWSCFSGLGFVRTDIFFESFCASIAKTAIAGLAER